MARGHQEDKFRQKSFLNTDRVFQASYETPALQSRQASGHGVLSGECRGLVWLGEKALISARGKTLISAWRISRQTMNGRSGPRWLSCGPVALL